jgi:fatty-acyl-CoA synthase
MNLAGTGAIPTYAVPEKILIVDALAKTSVGKLDKKTLRSTYGA